MIHVIKTTAELPGDTLYHQTHERPPDNVTAYEFTNWLQTVWFVPVENNAADAFSGSENNEYNGEGVA